MLAEALLKIFASRLIAEIERSSADEALRAAALAVSAASGRSVFAELARYLATILEVEMAFISRHQSDDASALHMLAMVSDGEVREGYRYPIQGTPCEHVLGQQFCAYPSNLHALFALDQDDRLLGAEGYAGLPLNDAHGRPLGTIGIVSRHALTNVERIESMLRIFAGRAAAEIEQLGGARGAAALGGQLPCHLRSVGGRDLHPRLVERRDPRRQPEGLRGLRLQPRRTVPAVAGRPALRRGALHGRAGAGAHAAGQARALPALRVASAQPRRRAALGRGPAEAGHDRRPPSHRGVHARHHRAQGAPTRRCATARSSTARSSTPRPTRWCCATPISASSTSTRPTRR